jgi:hypothetical protein
MCLETTKLEYAQEVLTRDPIIQSLTGGDLTNTIVSAKMMDGSAFLA